MRKLLSNSARELRQIPHRMGVMVSVLTPVMLETTVRYVRPAVTDKYRIHIIQKQS